MKTRTAIKLIFKLLTISLLCAGFTLSIMQEQWIWTFSLSAALIYELNKLVS